MRSCRKTWAKRHLRTATIYALSCCLLLNTSMPSALALEAGSVSSSTGVIGATWGDHTVIQTNHGAIIDWSNFNTSTGQSVTFNQYTGGSLSSLSAVLNRISSGSVPTQFNGALSANGRVFIANPAGIVFGASSTVNAVQLVASGLNMSNDAFIAVLAAEGNGMAFSGGNGQFLQFEINFNQLSRAG